MASTPPTSAARTEQLFEQLVQLTDAVKQLAEHTQPRTPSLQTTATEADRIRQRVTFGYQVIGTLSGRVSSGSGDEFDVPLVSARRHSRVIVLAGLPADAEWVELRSGDRSEVLRIERSDDRHDDDHDPRRYRPRKGVVRPRVFDDTDPIGSLLVLRDRRGPVLAFGPRLAAQPSSPTSPTSPTDATRSTDPTTTAGRTTEGAGHVSESR